MSTSSVGHDLVVRYVLMPMEDVHLDDVCAIERSSYSNPWSKKSFRYEIEREPMSWARVALPTAGASEIAGYCIAWIVFEHVHIQNVAVHPRHRRRGLGRFLVRRALEEGAARRATLALLEVRRSNVRAQKLYRDLGFCEAGFRKDYYSLPREDALVLRKDLGPAGA